MNTDPCVKDDAHLQQEGKDIADHENRCYLPGVYDRVLCANVGNEVAVGDVVEGEERGGRADDKEFLYGKEAETVWTVFGQVSEHEAQGFNWTKEGEEFSVGREMINEVALQNKPIGRHNPHHALDFTALNNSAAPAFPYTTAATIARTSFGRYPVGLSVGCPRR